MNTIRIREEVKEMRKAGVISAKLSGLWLHAPLFIQPSSRTFHWPDYSQWYDEHLQNKPSILPKRYPFDAFIIQDEEDRGTIYVVSAKDRFESIRVQQNGKSAYWRYSKIMDTDRKPTDHVLQLYKNGKPVDFRKYHKPDCTAASNWLSKLASKGVMVTPEEALFSHLALYSLNTVKRLCMAVMSNTSTILSVAPNDRVPRSAEWKLGRTHYVILSPKQAQKCSTQRRGPTDREIVLAAHWRRAHFRRLMAAKYSDAKRGKLVPVRQAWVGPKEWFGLDDKIYKVVEINENQK